MSSQILNLEPRSVWRNFADLNAFPRPSKGEQKVVAFMQAFGQRLGLDTGVDETGNVIIRKPATPGMEDRVGIVMQGHLDMVHQMNAGTQFDFASEGIHMRVDGDWVRAKGTTLGADNGIGVAYIMAILASEDIPHPAIEALFTVDEESGMTGALGLSGDALSGPILLNLDTEDDTELTIGCAGAINVLASGSYAPEPSKPGDPAFVLGVKGLVGGHSGMDIHRGRANANKLLNRVLFLATEKLGLRIGSIDAGGLRNAIPREAQARISVDTKQVGTLKEFVAEQEAVLRSEYAVTDPGLELCLEPADSPTSLLPIDFHKQLLSAIYTCPNGVFRLSPDIEGLVQTSDSMARVLAADGKFEVNCLVRSAVESEKMDLARAIRCAFEPIRASVEFSGSYPGWTPRPEAPIVKLMSGLYREMFGQEPAVIACHAGLECGIIGARYPDMQMISFGPNIRGAHSPDEQVQISSVQKSWRLLLAALERMPVIDFPR